MPVFNLYLLRVSLLSVSTLNQYSTFGLPQSSKLCLQFLLKYLQVRLCPLDFHATDHLVMLSMTTPLSYSLPRNGVGS